MRLVIINSCHPDTTHVCGLRARAFAEILTARGHQIILVTEPFEQTGQVTDLATLPQMIQDHDWATPCRISTPFASGSSLPAIRSGQFPAILRQGAIAKYFWRHSGVFEDWCEGTRPYLPVIAEAFAPEIIWAIFGHTGCWRMGQELAELAGCPWVADKKDPWAAFVPFPFRRLLATRFANAAHLTTLSASHLQMMRRWNSSIPATVIYSGIPKAFLSLPQENPGTEPHNKNILLCGSIYDLESLKDFYASLSGWLEKQSRELASRISVSYAGADTDRFFAATDPLKGQCAIDSHGLLSLDDLHACQRQAALNLHLYYPPTLFHHKMFELFASDRPVLCYPGESDETATISEQIGARLYRCKSEKELDKAFEETLLATDDNHRPINAQSLASFSWEEQAERLEQVFQQVCSG